MQAPEIEMKFVVHDISAFRTKVSELGLRLETERTFESNTLYDTPDRDLRAKTQVLRLRRYGERCVLTHKRVPDGGSDDAKYKTRIETETAVEDCSAVAEIFEQLGLTAAFSYEKFRTEWADPEGGHLVLDETPIGIYAELEGPPDWIDRTAEKLGVEAEDCSTASYGTLFLEWKERNGSEATHLTFDEIKSAARFVHT